MKLFYTQQNIGHAKYVVNHHDGIKKHKDGSNFFDINIFKNKKTLKEFVNNLIDSGYIKK